MLPEIFNFQRTPIRVVMQEGEPWWVANDVCRVLGIANPKTSLALLDEDEKGVHSMDSLGGIQRMTTISESGLYTLVLRSRKPEAKAFKRWITHEVLPAIRKTGMYGAEQALNDPQWLRQALAQAIEQVTDLQKGAERKSEDIADAAKPACGWTPSP